MEKKIEYYATGRRKTSVARTWLKPGKGEILINDRSLNDYFTLETARTQLQQPLLITNTQGSFDVVATVIGGGIQGQAGAIRHGITRALLKFNPELRVSLKRAGFISRDSRMKERKKYGQRSARARFQFSKR